ncbi:HIT domain-containing protein [Rhodococcus sp. (in: high G+C Gram-positive bacteria)]|uniref:HIT family protein n=1 Tax=Rhodococcus sp. TaxID=1831 RepID=UPI00339041F7
MFEDDFVVVSHRPPPPHGRSVPGYVFVETRRHVSGLPSLSEPEALAVARAVWRVSRVLDSELTPEFVFSAIAGRSVPHFHQHVFVRPFGAPSSVSWNDVDSWDDAPRVDEVELTLLCRRIALGFEAEQ